MQVFDKQAAAFRAGPAGAGTVIVTEGAFDAIAAAEHQPDASSFAPADSAGRCSYSFAPSQRFVTV